MIPAADVPLVDTATAAMAAGVEPATLRDWKRRGIIAPRGGTSRRPLWDLRDVKRAVNTPRPRRAT